jgi:hypothetical protein
MMRAAVLLALAAVACGGGAGRANAADGPLPSGNSSRRSLELEEQPEAPAAEAPPGDGTSTPEIVKSVEKDQP